MDLTKVDTICEKHRGLPEQLIGILQDVQKQYNYLPREALERVSQDLGVPLSRIYAVATFFKAFSLEPRGRHTCQVCMGTACHVRGAQRVLDEMERELGVSAGKTTADGAVTLETVNCVGCCALGPVAVVDGEYHGQLTAAKVRGIIPAGEAQPKKAVKPAQSKKRR
ncbi:MAG: NAD(P)H-dependent oxidoreductase subunit E [bacterium]